jgi:tRNA(Ile)-lysidine synthase
VRLTPGWVEAVLRRLDARLIHDSAVPLALALSGGGDSVALMHLAAEWAARRGRRILALTVDHGLNPDGARWTAFAETTARGLGADWQGLNWIGDKPQSGLPAAARAARHALLAETARAAGARVILVAHTADDVFEGDWMRAEGTPLGRLREWSPSPAWPQGRGLMLLRPLLDVARADLREFLVDRAASWIDDPANQDARFHRARARMALATGKAAPGAIERTLAVTSGRPLDFDCDPVTGVIAGPLDSPWLGHAVACASGEAAVPSPRAVEHARRRLSEGLGRTTLSGAVLVPEGGHVVVARERGRRPCPDLILDPGKVAAWDGRFEVLVSRPGWRIGAAAGRRSRLAEADRSALGALPSFARPSHPVLFREDGSRPLLADPSVETRCLVPERLRLASGVQREDDLETSPWRGLLRRPI